MLDFSLWLHYTLIVATKKGGECVGIHKGAKLTDTPKELTIRARVDLETAEKLTAICEKTGRSKSDIIREGINMQYAKMSARK